MNQSAHKISPDTIGRTVILVLALINQILAIAGHSTIDFVESDIYQIVSLCCTVAASLTAWWKNNSFTCVACQADEWRQSLKQQEKK